MGQKRRFDRLPFTSGLSPSTDIVGVRRHVANVPRCDIGANDAPTTRRLTITMAASWSGSASASQVRARLCSPSGCQRPRGCASERSGGEQRVAQLFRQVLHANDLVDRRADQRELQPLGHADIAVDNLAQMERYAEIECCVGRCRLRCAEPPARFVGPRRAPGRKPRRARPQRGTGQAPHRRSARRPRRHGRAPRPRSSRNSCPRSCRKASAESRSASSVERRRSLYHNAAVIFSPSPRRIKPLSTAWPARLPR